MRTLTVIPTRYEPARLEKLMRSVDGDVMVLDNGHEPPLTDARDARGLGIYAMWNLGWRHALVEGYEMVAIINDDIRILPGTIPFLARALAGAPSAGVVYPDWPVSLRRGLPRLVQLRATHGTVGSGGMSGYCFAFRPSLPVPPFDEGYHWWYGDDAFERSVRAAGYMVCRVIGLPLEHDSDAMQNGWARRPELAKLIELDRARFFGS